MAKPQIFALAAMLALSGCQDRSRPEQEIAIAVRSNDAAKVQAYLEAGGDPDFVNRDGDPLLYIASGPKGGAEVLNLLIAGGADVDLPSHSGRTPLANAAGWCDTGIVSLLLAAGASIEPLAQADGGIEASVCQQPLDKRQDTLALLSGQSRKE